MWSSSGQLAAIVLAAGASTRLGRPKQLLTCRGQAMVRAIAQEVRAVVTDVAVVIGAYSDEVRNELRGLDIHLVVNGDWQEGMASSIRAGVRWASTRPCAAAFLLVADQPRLTAGHLLALKEAYERAGAERPMASRYDGALGVPALLGRGMFPALMSLRGGQGARQLLRAGAGKALGVDWPEGLDDVDTEADVARLLGAQSEHR